MTVILMPSPRMQFEDANGKPLAGGLVYTYAAGTTTPQASYTDSTGTILNTNPVVLDSGGYASIWLDVALSYKILLQTSAAVQVWMVDNVIAIPPGIANTGQAQTWTALQTLRDLAIIGPIPAGFPAAAQQGLFIAGGDPTNALGTNVIGRIYNGNGTGWYLGITKRTGGVDTDMITFSDAGNIIMRGNKINIGAGGLAGNPPTPTANDVQLQSGGVRNLFCLAGDSSGDADFRARDLIASRNLTVTGKVNAYNGNVALVGTGIPYEVATVDLLAQQASIGTTTLFAIPVTGAGQYRIAWNNKVTQLATTSCVQGPLVFTYVDPDGQTITVTAPAVGNTGAVVTTVNNNSLTTGFLIGVPMILNCAASTNITYNYTYQSVGATPMQYNLHIRLEAL